MADSEAVLFANEAFYQAFNDRDLVAMGELWSPTAPVCCIHPGWAPVFGRDEVLASWAAILGNPDSPGIEVGGARAHLCDSTAFVVCFESLGGGYLTATNIFVRDGSLWKIVHHQAGPTSVPQTEDETEEEGPEQAVH